MRSSTTPLEADSVRRFAAFHAEDDFVLIPEVIGERSSKRVLTLSYLPGDDINHLGEEYTQDVRDALSLNLFKMMSSQIFEHGEIHADPNPANFAFRPDGSICLYDFGCTKRLKPEIIEAIRDIVRSTFFADYEQLDDALIRLGARVPNKPALSADFYAPYRELFLGPHLSDAPYDHGQASTHEGFMKLLPHSLRKIAYFQPPVEGVFVDRVAVGHYGNLRKLAGRAYFLDVLLPYLGLGPEDRLSQWEARKKGAERR